MNEQVRPYIIVVGVSDTSSSAVALRWAAEEAASHGGTVVAVRAWRPPPAPSSASGRPPVTDYEPRQLYAGEQERLTADVTSVLGDGHEVECRLVVGGRRKALISAARNADLLVVDAPRRTDLKTSPFFAQRLIYSAPCPVVVMPPAVAGEGDTAVVRTGKRLGREIVRSAATAGRPGVRPPHIADEPPG